MRKLFIQKAKAANLLTVISGGLVFFSSAFITDNGFAKSFFSHPFSVGLIVVATIILPFLWKVLEKGFTWRSRILAGAELLLIYLRFMQFTSPLLL